MCPDHSDWFGCSGLDDHHSPSANRSVVTKFLQAHPTDYTTKKLQVGIFDWFLVSNRFFFYAVILLFLLLSEDNLVPTYCYRR